VTWTCFIKVLPLLLLSLAGCPYVAEEKLPAARVATSLGEFVIELEPEKAPATVENFTGYVAADFYDDTVFHRVVAGSLVQGGAYDREYVLKEAGDPVENESRNGLSNVRGAVALYYAEDPNSATSQFIINVADHPEFDATEEQAGFTVFGRVTEGMEVVDQIAAVPTAPRGDMEAVPVEDVVIEDIELFEIPTGRLVITPAGEEYLARQPYRAAVLLRETLVELVGLLASRD